MSILRLYITEHWPLEPECDWALLGADGQATEQGRSDPRHWPKADACEVLLAGAQVVWLSVRLPRAPKREQERLVRFALEDQLIQEPDSQHFVISDRQDEQARVIVVARERMRNLAAQLEALHRVPHFLGSELEYAPQREDGWTLTLTSTHALLAGPGPCPIPLDIETPDQPPSLLVALLEQARESNRLPARVVLCRAEDVAAVDLDAWTQALGLPVEDESPYAWYSFSAATNLLQGEFLPNQRRGAAMRRLRPALMLAGGVLALELVISLGQVMWQRQQVSDAQAKMRSVFTSTLPNQPMVNPAAQLRRQVNEQRRQHGQLPDDDVLSLLTEYGEAAGGDARESLQEIRYEEGRVDLTPAPSMQPRMQALVERLRQRGMTVSASPDGKLALRREALQ